ncbi:flagellar hook-length control protein FliK [Sporomusa acidovorans]|uniref:Flagellar hook-length control protein-like C-terminal domain-containing protein n=1 Tax=Sporomusa acidovorans (strain ATCC 49682 / DSM 3132 / Mol) TaxID=1123286 RepID=A0ABZ3J3E2_SPOA4|nr:flagellar hook-length control protein FliK [Sporomusa acidovorans]OZC20066.1 flagellar hook-length control protein FliK [Sporomusa acidovorans DSM 3132]SDD46124.1 hook-length control protein FliK [Sporomusa acidovorans]
MNVGINLLQSSASSQATVSKSSSSGSSSGEPQNSFNDTLNKAVTETNETTVKDPPEQAVAEKLTNAAKPQNISKKDETDSKGKNVSLADESTKTNSNESDKDVISPQDVLPSVANPALVTALLIGVPVINTSTASTPTVVKPEQATAAIVAGQAAVANQPQMATNTVQFATLVQQGLASVSENNLKPNNQNGVLKFGQEKPEILAKLSGNISNAVSGNTVTQENLPQNQAVTVETTLSPNGAVLAQTAESVQNGRLKAGNSSQATVSQATGEKQNQAAQAKPAANSSGFILPQTAAGLQNASSMQKPAQNPNDQAAEQNQAPVEQTVIPTVGSNQQGRMLSSDLTGEGQKNLTDSKMLNGEQDLSIDTKVISSSVFSQNLDAALLSTNAIASFVNTADSQAATTPSADVQQVLDQIVEQTKIITKPQNTEMVMKLKPEHLGELTLKVAIENGVVNASFHSNNPEVRSLIETSLPQLKQELVNSGLKVDNVSVYAGLSQFQPNQGQSQNSRQQLTKAANKKSAENFIEAIDGELATGGISGIGSQAGVDYRI